MLVITIQQTENGYYVREEFQDENDIGEETRHICFGSFKDMMFQLAEVLEVDKSEVDNVIKLIKKD
jgi:hypothetical protein